MSKATLTSGRRAPITHYVLAATSGAVATIGVALLVGATNSADFWPAAGIGAMCATYPSFSLGVKIFVTNHTVTRDERGEESVESLWMKQAGAGTFLDVLVATLVIAIVLMLNGNDVDALPVLLGLIGLSVVDVGLRYAVVRHRALR